VDDDDLSLEDADYALRLYREYLESRELTASDLAYIGDRSRRLIARAQARAASPAPFSPDSFSPLRRQDFAEVYGEIFPLIATIRGLLAANGTPASVAGPCPRCRGERYLRAVDLLCRYCGGNIGCDRCQHTYHTLCSKCGGAGQVAASDRVAQAPETSSERGASGPSALARVRDPSGGPASPSGPYRTVTIDWTKENLGDRIGHAIYLDSGVHDRQLIAVQEMVMFFLEPYFAEGWRLDGPYQQAVDYLYEDAWIFTRRKLWKVVVRLRRG
jgi:hypothetical protein